MKGRWETKKGNIGAMYIDGPFILEFRNKDWTQENLLIRKFLMTQNSFFSKLVIIPACWHSNPRERPLFPAILEQLDRIRQSEFTRAPHESFHTMQDGWRLEIEEVLRDLRRKEKVCIFTHCERDKHLLSSHSSVSSVGSHLNASILVLHGMTAANEKSY